MSDKELDELIAGAGLWTREDQLKAAAAITQLRGELNASQRNERLHINLSDALKMALDMPGTGSYIEWAKECRAKFSECDALKAELAATRASGAEDADTCIALRQIADNNSDLTIDEREWCISAATRIESLAAQNAALTERVEKAERDAGRWNAMATLWTAYAEVTLRQDESGYWSIDCCEGIDVADQKLAGSDPDAVMDTLILSDAIAREKEGK